MQNLDVPANWEDAEDARLESRQAVASLIHSPRARERFMADDASLSSAHSRQTSAYGGHPQKNRSRFQSTVSSTTTPSPLGFTKSAPTPPQAGGRHRSWRCTATRSTITAASPPLSRGPSTRHRPQDRRTTCPSSERRMCPYGRGSRSHRARRRLHRGRRQPASRLNRKTASASGRKSRPPGVRPQRWTSSESC